MSRRDSDSKRRHSRFDREPRSLSLSLSLYTLTFLSFPIISSYPYPILLRFRRPIADLVSTLK